MQVKAYKTHKVTAGEDLYKILDGYLPLLQERSVVAISSKIISLCQGNIVKNDGRISKEDLVKQEADYYIENKPSQYGNIMLTRRNGLLIFSSGIDESNTNEGGDFLLLPEDIQEMLGEIWHYLRKKYGLREVGVITTDSRLIPCRAGVVGLSHGWCGFSAVNDFVGKKDIFGREIRMTKVNVTESLATAAVFVMGETNEQTPLAVIADLPNVSFQSRPPSREELEAVSFSIEDDMYGKLLTSVRWVKGGRKGE